MDGYIYRELQTGILRSLQIRKNRGEDAESVLRFF